MKYLFVFLLVGLVSCGDASGDATKVSKANVNSHINENTDWTKAPNCDDIEGLNIKGKLKYQNWPDNYTGWIKECKENGKISYLEEFSNGRFISSRRWSNKREQNYFLGRSILRSSDKIKKCTYRWLNSESVLLEEYNYIIENYKEVEKVSFGITNLEERLVHMRHRNIKDETVGTFIRHGLYRGHPDMKSVYFEGNYKMGLMDGLWRIWWEKNGQLQREFNCKGGALDGLYRWWTKNGQLESEANFKDGEEISRICFDKDGNEIQCR